MKSIKFDFLFYAQLYALGLEDDITGKPVGKLEFAAAVIITDTFTALGNLKKL